MMFFLKMIIIIIMVSRLVYLDEKNIWKILTITKTNIQ